METIECTECGKSGPPALVRYKPMHFCDNDCLCRWLNAKLAVEQLAEADRAGSPDAGAAKAANRIALFGGIVGDYDGAYEWIKESEYGLPENSLGFHECHPDESYTVCEVL